MKTCPSCDKKFFADNEEFCDEDGSKLIIFNSNAGVNVDNITKNDVLKGETTVDIDKNLTTGENLKANSEFKPARITLKTGGSLTGKFFDLTSSSSVVGRFNSSTGPIDIDVSGLSGAEHISRKHAKFTFERGKWFISDMGSTNGVFIKRNGAAEFSPRLVEPAELSNGDEVSLGNMVFLFAI